jgi:hypothetical protein
MSVSNFMHGWAVLLGSLATIVLTFTAFGIMLGMLKLADAARHTGAVIGIMIVLLLLPGVLANLWSGMSLWPQIGLVSIGIGILLWRRTKPRRDEGK